MKGSVSARRMRARNWIDSRTSNFIPAAFTAARHPALALLIILRRFL
jgi:hypothetical protein